MNRHCAVSVRDSCRLDYRITLIDSGISAFFEVVTYCTEWGNSRIQRNA
jgi:hypothetical protein